MAKASNTVPVFRHQLWWYTCNAWSRC